MADQNASFQTENEVVTKDIRDRLLDAAEKLFSEHGFADTSVRDITAEANCNVAAVNYHFGSKEKLYADVWRRNLLLLRNNQLAGIEKVMSNNQSSPSLEDLLKSFAETFIGPLVNKTGSSRLLKLMMREMLDRHLPPNMFADEVIKPTLGAMQKALLKTCPGLDESRVALIVFSIVGQLIHAVRIRTMFGQSNGSNLPIFDFAEMIDHIIKFSAAGIRACAGEKTI
ncbi:MAG: CerR family C-terminal domain-containing protein [Phycisphaerae bacterium]|nr:CerR family C-terminal domain-containing protein [Phycisphaerae bacterium]MDD5381187.1 CerR family C-terminal domain-containing protein [Phycisphaerae bacterium]